VPPKPAVARRKSSDIKRIPDTELLPQLSFAGSLLLRRWAELPEKAPDGTVRFTPQHCKSLFALVCFGPRGVPYECRLLRSAEMVLGREEGFLQIIHDPAVSGRHAQLTYREDVSLILTDLNSTNGTFFRTRPNQGYRLWDGCNVIIGQQVLTFRSSCEAAPANTRVRAQTIPLRTQPKTETGFGKLVLANTGNVPREFSLTGPTVVGRAGDNAQIVFPDDLFISPAHARLDFNVKLQQTIITDLKSMNGVYVQIRQPVVLEDGDMFRLGEQIFAVIRC
jgi:pSer/pThr/pTyr-binding forkhead associated (FHA) protein